MRIKVTHLVTFEHLNLGNNFTTNHLINAIAEHDSAEELLEYLWELECGSEVRIKADIKFNHSINEVYVSDELYDMLEDAFNKKNDEDVELPNECMMCGEPIEEDKMFCSKECLQNDLNLGKED